ncbi:MAG: thiosulfate oxidation carrier protein SoxY [Sulfurimonas sp.]|jgi:sulfur-oxidizing protein SoxY|nr:thiosulfate oxidation carrier protein SoxY [Sulfurimonas sp.]
MNRRLFCKVISVLALFSFGRNAFAAETLGKKEMDELLFVYTDKKPYQKKFVSIDAPNIAENGLVVPMKIFVNIKKDDPLFPKKLHLIASKNPFKKICSITFSKRNGRAFFATRVKLARSQDVIALVELGDGSFVYDTKFVKVTIGGCG